MKLKNNSSKTYFFDQFGNNIGINVFFKALTYVDRKTQKLFSLIYFIVARLNATLAFGQTCQQLYSSLYIPFFQQNFCLRQQLLRVTSEHYRPFQATSCYIFLLHMLTSQLYINNFRSCFSAFSYYKIYEAYILRFSQV